MARPRKRDFLCPECGGTMCQRTSIHGLFWSCENWPECDITVGAHQKGEKKGQPLGKPVNRATRQSRIHAHDWFDQLWKEKSMSRRKAYEWLARAMDLRKAQCHIGNMDSKQCEQVVILCKEKMEKL